VERYSQAARSEWTSAPNISLLKPDRKTIEVNDGMITLKISNNFCVTRQNKRIIYPRSTYLLQASLFFSFFYKLTFNLRARKRVRIYIRGAMPSLKSIFTDKMKTCWTYISHHFAYIRKVLWKIKIFPLPRLPPRNFNWLVRNASPGIWILINTANQEQDIYCRSL